MPLYFFHIRDHARRIVDEEGFDLPDTEAAMHEAQLGAVDMLREALLEGEDIRHQVIEISVNNQTVGTITLASIVETSH
jgi:hypothetical protein